MHQPLIDCHFHSNHSFDSRAPLAAMCRRALELGLTHVCPTEHADFDPQDAGYGYLDVEGYFGALDACQAQLDGQIVVLKGVEVDYQSRFEAEVRAFLARHAFDFVIGSAHYADGLYIEDALLAAYDLDTAYRRYFNAVREVAASGLFDVVGHLDLLKRYRPPPGGVLDVRRYADEIDAILRAAVETGTGLEINTSGLRQAPAETFPGLETLRRYRELGGQVLTLGSDAHRPEDLGKNVGDGLALARAAGFEAIAVFVNRQPRWLDIGD
jgi:histidinol-phosphatase (PHP family)